MNALPAGPAIQIGLVSDTHALLRAELEDVFRGVSAIVHAGDVGAVAVLDDLRQIAPVTAVAGNVDVVVPGLELPALASFECEGVHMLITHYAGEPGSPLPPVAEAMKQQRTHIVLSGHTHRPALQVQAGCLFANPGSAGPRRFRLPVSCGRLTLTPGPTVTRAEIQVIDLTAGTILLQETLNVQRG